ncbi:MAG: response regulator [bacterium]
MIKILIADDNPLIRDGIKMRLKQDSNIRIVGMAGNGKEALNLCTRENPDIVLLDIRMPIMDGLEATKQIKAYNSKINVVILTSYAEREYIEKAKEYKCNGFIYKESKLEDFLSVIKNVYNGFDVWTKDILYKDSSVNFVNQEFNYKELEGLSKKEIALIKCKVKCLQYSEIALDLNYSESYVRQLAVQLKDKLGLNNVNELAVWGAKRGL